MTLTFAIITGPEIAIVVGLVVVLFGADRIPKLARSMGEAKKEFEAAQRSQASPGSAPPPGSMPPPATGVPPQATTGSPSPGNIPPPIPPQG